MADPLAATQQPGTDEDIATAGMGEQDMSAFLRSHMESILKPFGENVEELHKTVVNLTSKVAELQEKTEKDTVILQQHHARMDAAQGRQDKLIERAEATRTMLEGSIDEAGKVDKARSLRVDGLEETLAYWTKQIEEVRKIAEDSPPKIVALQDVEKTTRNDIFELKNEIPRVEAKIGKSDEAHEALAELVRRNKLTFNSHVKDFKELEQEQRYLRAKFVALNDDLTDKVKALQGRHQEIHKTFLQHRKESEDAHEATAKLLSERKDAADEVRKEAQTQLDKLKVEVALIPPRIDENDTAVKTLLSTTQLRLSGDIQNVRDDVKNLEFTFKIPSQVAELQTKLGVGQGPNRIDLLEEEADLAYKRSLRLEKVLQLEPITKENMDVNPRVSLQHGMLLTEEQMEAFQAQFNLYDLDHSGAVSAAEVKDILFGLGFEVEQPVVDLVMAEIDIDGSGEVNFEEFCSLMTKMLGPDGNLDVDGYMKKLSDNATREARQNEIVELFPSVQDEVKKHQKEIVNTQTKLTSTTAVLQTLEVNHAQLQKEVEKLRKGLELNDGYWKGMRTGLKDTKKTVYHEGDGQMLPTASTLRKALPPLASLSVPLNKTL